MKMKKIIFLIKSADRSRSKSVPFASPKSKKRDRPLLTELAAAQRNCAGRKTLFRITLHIEVGGIVGYQICVRYSTSLKVDEDLLNL